MTPALKSRLSAERLFTADDIALFARVGFATGSKWAAEAVISGGSDGFDAAMKDCEQKAFDQALARVKTHLTSDTTTIRPRKA